MSEYTGYKLKVGERKFMDKHFEYPYEKISGIMTGCCVSLFIEGTQISVYKFVLYFVLCFPSAI